MWHVCVCVCVCVCLCVCRGLFGSSGQADLCPFLVLKVRVVLTRTHAFMHPTCSAFNTVQHSVHVAQLVLFLRSECTHAACAYLCVYIGPAWRTPSPGYTSPGTQRQGTRGAAKATQGASLMMYTPHTQFLSLTHTHSHTYTHINNVPADSTGNLERNTM